MKESRGRGHAHQRGDLGAAARLAVDHHAVRIAAEVGDVVMNPLQGRHQIGHAHVDRIGVGGAADLREVEEAENVEAVIDRDLHDVMMPRHLRAFM